MTAPRRRLPEPLVPADCDLGGMASFQLDTQRLLHSDLAVIATGEQFRAAVLLWCRAWQQTPPASLPNDDRILAAYAGVPFDRWSEVGPMALRGWRLCSDGRLYHPILADDALRAAASKRFHSSRAKLGAEARWAGHTKKERPKKWGRNASGNASTNASSMPKAMPADAQWQRQRERGDEPPAAAAAASRPEGGDAKPGREVGAPGSGPAPDPAAAASINPDANAMLRALLGKYGLAASPQATLEWEGMLRRKGMTKVAAVRSFLRFCGKRGDVQFARQAEPLVAEWTAGAV